MILGLVLPLLSGEVMLRVFGPIVPGRYSAGLHQELHPIYGRFQVPDTSGWYRSEEFVSHVAFNSLGLRERAIPIPKPKGEHRILVLGDSFVQGAEVEEEQTLTRRLEERLRDAGHPALVINAGVAGFSTDQELLLLEELGWSLEPDLVVLIFYLGNDVTENSAELTQIPKLYFALGTNEALASVDRRLPDRRPENSLSRLHRLSRLLSVVDTGVMPKLRAIPGLGGVLSSPIEAAGPEPVGAGPGGSDVFRAQYTDAWLRAWRVTELLLGRMHEESARRDVPFLLVGAPTKWEIYPEDWLALLEQNRLPSTGWDLSGPGQRLGTIAKERAIAYRSLLPELREQASFAPRRYFKQDVHWTAGGHDAVADALAKTVLEPPLLEVWDSPRAPS